VKKLEITIIISVILISGLIFGISESFAEEEWQKYRLVGYFYLPNGQLDYQSQEIPYLIYNGQLTNVKILVSGTKLSFKISTFGDGVLELKIPRSVVDVTIGSIDDPFAVLHDGVEKKFTEKNPTQNDLICFRHIVIPFSKDTSKIEIVSFFLKEEPFRNALNSLYSVDCLVDPSPILQIKSGIKPENISCKDDFELIFKSKTGSPACVKLTSVEKLIGRGWVES
jgi:hypothetical protein